MRTEESWNTRVLPGKLKKFPLRIQQVLQNVEIENIPEVIESCYIWGESGTGKTIYASALLLEEEKQLYLNKRCLQDGDDYREYEKYENSIGNTECVFVTMVDLITRIKKTYDKDATETESSVLEYYSNVHLLLIDDFGTVKPTDWLLLILYSIINHRYDYLKKTIFTSNFDLNAAAVSMGDNRLTSRIERMCEGNLIEKEPYKRK